TVRGFEGVLSSFPPLPGDSIVKRDHSENVETIARVLKRDGYDTVFLYGGRGIFDGMRSYAVNNGYDRFVEQKDFSKPTFATIWGVCNEDLYRRTIEECRALAKAGKPFLATVLSVSNHKPFTYPPGRIAEDPQARKREHAVKYTDWALGQFFKEAKNEPFFQDTIFVVIADHGARVYGSQSIPIHSYEIPLLILGPAAVKKPARLAQLGCQLDVAPTILGLIGRPYDTMFYGHDLLKDPVPPGRVLINHNRDIGLMRDDRMVVLSLNKKAEFYRGNPKVSEMTRVDRPDDTDVELEKDAMAIYQTADELYMQRKYRVQETARPQ
ncbi:MAG TPA: LTA synthase family protein, partial [Candidatus Binatia bacterium]|nr:LTA synthase family protein [Candidatus Binatia bacterium]